jgi:hypothetical protein
MNIENTNKAIEDITIEAPIIYAECLRCGLIGELPANYPITLLDFCDRCNDELETIDDVDNW